MKTAALLMSFFALGLLAGNQNASAAGAPAWMHAQVNAPLPEHDAATTAVLLYSETVLTVQGVGKIKQLDRRAYRILRPEGREYGLVRVSYDPQSPITSMHAWSIPASGADFETKDKDIVDVSAGAAVGELVSDTHAKLLRIPAAEPGSIVGYEVEQVQRPYFMTSEWDFQETIPVREAHYSVQLPAGWTYKSFWLNYPEVQPASATNGQFQWVLSDLKRVPVEGSMPPWRGIAGRLVVSLQPPNGQAGGFTSWEQVGTWYLGLTDGRRDSSTAIKQKVLELTASQTTLLAKARALAAFVQADVRYVAIELGIGGFQPHRANEVFAQRYGDCKDKVTLLSAMLKEIGIDSYYVIINTTRGAVSASTPPNIAFNHVVLAMQLPADADAAQLPGAINHPKLGRLLFFDPTQTLVPFGSLPGYLQSNFGMLVAPYGGELVELPQPAIDFNGVRRSAKLSLDETGTLQGDVLETWAGDAAVEQRSLLQSAASDSDQIKPVEALLSHSLGTFRITKAGLTDRQLTDRPLGWRYSVNADQYAKTAGDLLIVRPRVIGSESSSLLETKEPRVHPIEFYAPRRDTDTFEITMPEGYVVDDLPPRVDADLGFIAYHSKSEVVGRVLRYSRTFEIRQADVPASRANELREFFRTVDNDERMSAVLKKQGPHG